MLFFESLLLCLPSQGCTWKGWRDKRSLSWLQETRFHVMTRCLTGCMILGKLLNPSVPQCPPLPCEDGGTDSLDPSKNSITSIQKNIVHIGTQAMPIESIHPSFPYRHFKIPPEIWKSSVPLPILLGSLSSVAKVNSRLPILGYHVLPGPQSPPCLSTNVLF